MNLKQVNMHDAKTNLSLLVKGAVEGEPFIIAVNGAPKVKVTAYNSGTKTPRIGFLKGYGKVPPDFDSIGQDEIEALFEGKS
jgi:prevent-host-death family protein